MTLNITVLTDRLIYQCADYRMVDVDSGVATDLGGNQKLQLTTHGKWHATVCFNGVGRFRGISVGKWLGERLGSIAFSEPFDRLYEELFKADEWLSQVPHPHNRHSFTIGAFVGSKPIFALITNYESMSGLPANSAGSSLVLHEHRPTEARTFVSGQTQAVSREERWRLSRLASRGSREQMFDVLYEINQRASKRSNLVSPGCFTSYVERTGDGGGRPNGTTIRSTDIGLPDVGALLGESFTGGRQLTQFVSSRADDSDDYHQTRLRDRPNEAGTYLNYGAFLQNKKSDLVGAEREYRRALELEPNFVVALSNLASLVRKRGENAEAQSLYARALAIEPGNEIATWGYAHFLVDEQNEVAAARELLSAGIEANPRSGRLAMYRALIDLGTKRYVEALEGFILARELGADQAQVEFGYSCALFLTGAPLNECVDAYRTAVAVNPQSGNLKGNLSQVLFIAGYASEALRSIDEARKLNPSAEAQLEISFYLLAHTEGNAMALLATMKSLIVRGTRVTWNLSRTIEAIRIGDPTKAAILDPIAKVLLGEGAVDSLESLGEALLRVST